ncbi:MAG TPA: hypothetical protein VK866_01250 [Acidimicrobiales bacterium]|nr:hypothetical protein [Acidimicrobiales bacterium]
MALIDPHAARADDPRADAADASRADAVRELAARIRPVTLAERKVLAVADPLRPLCPDGGLRRGSVVGVTGPVAASLVLALVAEASGQGSWVALVDLPDLGLVAAAELGVALDRVAVVPHLAPGTWAGVLAALVDAVDLVVVGVPPRVRDGDVRRLTARARERGAVLLAVGDVARWPRPPDLTLTTGPGRWSGLGSGHGHLRARRVRVTSTGRRGADRPRARELWLPAADGGLAPVEHPAARGADPGAGLRVVG